MKPFSVLVLFFFLLSPIRLHAIDSEAEIKAVLATQVEAWNRGDLPAFVETYALDCIFVGKQIRQGRGDLLDHYRRSYPTIATMGHLSFNGLAVHLLDRDVAMVTSEWHLDRSADAGGPAGGLFSLVLRRQNGHWKIALDHTS